MSEPPQPTFGTSRIESAQAGFGRALVSPELSLRPSEVMDALGVTRRQLQYWADTDLISASARTPGGHHRYCFRDLIAIQAAKRLIDSGMSLQRLRGSIEALQRALSQMNGSLAGLSVVATGEVVVIIRDHSAYETVSGHEWVFDVDEFEAEIAMWHARRSGTAVRRARPGADRRDDARSA